MNADLWRRNGQNALLHLLRYISSNKMGGDEKNIPYYLKGLFMVSKKDLVIFEPTIGYSLSARESDSKNILFTLGISMNFVMHLIV